MQHPPSDAGGKVWGGVVSAVSFGFAGGLNTMHWAGMWAADGNGAPLHDHAKDNASHISQTGENHGVSSGNSKAYWETWDSAVIRLCP